VIARSEDKYEAAEAGSSQAVPQEQLS